MYVNELTSNRTFGKCQTSTICKWLMPWIKLEIRERNTYF